MALAVSCAEPTKVDGVEWKITTLNGSEVKGAESDSYTILFGEEGRFSGKGECNRIIGSYKLSNSGELTIESKGATMMFCPNIEQEESFIKGLESVTRYKTKGGELQLFADKKQVATFKLQSK